MNDKSHDSGSGAVRVSANPGRLMHISAARRDGHQDRRPARIEPRREVDVPDKRSHRVRART